MGIHLQQATHERAKPNLGRGVAAVAALAALAAGLSVFGSPGAHAQSQAAAVQHDTRCLLTMGALANNPKNRPFALFGVYYYAGKITAHDPSFDFSARLKAAASRTSDKELNEGAHECADEVSREYQALNAAQASLAPSPAPAPAPAPK